MTTQNEKEKSLEKNNISSESKNESIAFQNIFMNNKQLYNSIYKNIHFNDNISKIDNFKDNNSHNINMNLKEFKNNKREKTSSIGPRKEQQKEEKKK